MGLKYFPNLYLSQISFKTGFCISLFQNTPPCGYLGFQLSYRALQKTKRILMAYLQGRNQVPKLYLSQFSFKTGSRKKIHPTLVKIQQLPQFLSELQSSYKMNPHAQLIWGRINFQSSIYYSFPLKPGCIWEIIIYLISKFIKQKMIGHFFI